MRNWQKLLLGAILAGGFIGVFGAVGQSDYEDAQKETAHYCEMVRGGHWPDFKGWYQRVCKGGLAPVVTPSQSARKRSA